MKINIFDGVLFFQDHDFPMLIKPEPLSETDVPSETHSHDGSQYRSNLHYNIPNHLQTNSAYQLESKSHSSLNYPHGQASSLHNATSMSTYSQHLSMPHSTSTYQDSSSSNPHNLYHHQQIQCSSGTFNNYHDYATTTQGEHVDHNNNNTAGLRSKNTNTSSLPRRSEATGMRNGSTDKSIRKKPGRKKGQGETSLSLLPSLEGSYAHLSAKRALELHFRTYFQRGL